MYNQHTADADIPEAGLLFYDHQNLCLKEHQEHGKILLVVNLYLLFFPSYFFFFSSICLTTIMQGFKYMMSLKRMGFPDPY